VHFPQRLFASLIQSRSSIQPMTHDQLNDYLQAQVSEIIEFMRAESERRGQELTLQEAALEWCEHYSEHFGVQWESNQGPLTGSSNPTL